MLYEMPPANQSQTVHNGLWLKAEMYLLQVQSICTACDLIFAICFPLSSD